MLQVGNKNVVGGEEKELVSPTVGLEQRDVCECLPMSCRRLEDASLIL